MSTPGTVVAPTCPRGHGGLRRARSLSTGLYPGWNWHCRNYWTCDTSVFWPVSDGGIWTDPATRTSVPRVIPDDPHPMHSHTHTLDREDTP